MQLNLTYSVPITESMEGNDFCIQGTAINETTTSNNHKFLAEELRPAAQTLTGCPLLVDHENKVENIKGRVLMGNYNELGNRVDFKARVMDETCKQMIKDGRLNSVSVGAMVKDVEEKDGELIPRGITFKELSLVAVPADSGATFSIAMKEAYNSAKPQVIETPAVKLEIETSKVEVKEEVKAEIKEEIKVESQQINPENVVETIKDVQGTDKLIEMKGGLEQMSENITEAKVDENAALKEQIAMLVKEVASMKEAATKKAEEKVVLRNEFEEADAEVKEDYKIVQGAGYFSYVANSY